MATSANRKSGAPPESRIRGGFYFADIPGKAMCSERELRRLLGRAGTLNVQADAHAKQMRMVH
jgi:hypothetical protein